MDNLKNNYMNNEQIDCSDYKVPEKFLDKKSGKIRIDTLIKSYLELEKKLSSTAQQNNISDNILTKSLKNNDGNNIDPADIAIELHSDILMNNVNMNKELLDSGFNIPQIQKVYDIIENWVIPEFIDFTKQIYFENEIQKLNNTFGGQDKFQIVAKQLYNWAVKNLSIDVLKILSSSYFGIVAMYYMMLNSEPMIDTSLNDNENTIYTPDTLKVMMQNPKYWLQQDPDFIRQVSDGFKYLYNNNS